MSATIKCPGCFTLHELVRYVRKGGKSQVGTFCDHHPVVRSHKGATVVVEHMKFYPCGEDQPGLREIFTPAARKQEAQKGQLQFVMGYADPDKAKGDELEAKLARELAERNKIEKAIVELEVARRKIEAEARNTSAQISEIKTIKLL